MPDTSQMILVRHGETQANRRRHFAESDDIPLSEIGRGQAQELALRLAREFHPELLLSSPFLRARQTSEIIGRVLKLETGILAGIHEREFGCLRGQPYERMGEMMLADAGYDSARPWMWTPSGGESLEDVRTRCISVLEGVRMRCSGEILVVCHGAVIQAITAHMTGQWNESSVPPNCGFVVIEGALIPRNPPLNRREEKCAHRTPVGLQQR